MRRQTGSIIPDGPSQPSIRRRPNSARAPLLAVPLDLEGDRRPPAAALPPAPSPRGLRCATSCARSDRRDGSDRRVREHGRGGRSDRLASLLAAVSAVRHAPPCCTTWRVVPAAEVTRPGAQRCEPIPGRRLLTAVSTPQNPAWPRPPDLTGACSGIKGRARSDGPAASDTGQAQYARSPGRSMERSGRFCAIEALGLEIARRSATDQP